LADELCRVRDGRARGGAGRFFYQGTHGRWRDVLTENDFTLYEAAAADLAPELRSWLEAGSAS
jgi:aryl sulfotransferase